MQLDCQVSTLYYHVFISLFQKLQEYSAWKYENLGTLCI